MEEGVGDSFMVPIPNKVTVKQISSNVANSTQFTALECGFLGLLRYSSSVVFLYVFLEVFFSTLLS